MPAQSSGAPCMLEIPDRFGACGRLFGRAQGLVGPWSGLTAIWAYGANDPRINCDLRTLQKQVATTSIADVRTSGAVFPIDVQASVAGQHRGASGRVLRRLRKGMTRYSSSGTLVLVFAMFGQAHMQWGGWGFFQISGDGASMRCTGREVGTRTSPRMTLEAMNPETINPNFPIVVRMKKFRWLRNYADEFNLHWPSNTQSPSRHGRPRNGAACPT